MMITLKGMRWKADGRQEKFAKISDENSSLGKRWCR
jgi:hypothetical protein